jgi:hypothetical protein
LPAQDRPVALRVPRALADVTRDTPVAGKSVRRSVRVDVDAEVESVVIPIRVMLTAPVAFTIEAVDIVIHLPAVRAKARCVAIDAFLRVAEPLVALVPPVVIGASRAAQGK